MYNYFLTYNGETTEIDREPIGWDGFTVTLTRDADYHGIGVEYADSNLKFYDAKSLSILKTAYDTDVDSIVTFTVKKDGVIEYEGQIDFGQYSEGIEKYRYISVKVAQIGAQTLLNNRNEQEVNINQLVSFDGEALPAYSNIDKEMDMQGMTLILTSSGRPNADQTQDVDSFDDIAHIDGNLFMPRINLGFYDDVLTDLTTSNIGWPCNFSQIWSTQDSVTTYADLKQIWVKNINSLIRCTDKNFIIKFRWKGSVQITGPLSNIFAFYISGHLHSKPTNNADLWALPAIPISTDNPNVVVVEIDTGDVVVTVEDIDELYFDFLLRGQFYNELILVQYDVTVNTSKDSYFSITATSTCDDTIAKVTKVHEALSRVVENVTNGELTVKSDFYGRPDSEINPTVEYGAGSLKAITSGRKIRNALLTDGTEPYLTLKWLDSIKGLSAIDNIGFGITVENGQQFVRVEPWTYFYNSNVILTIHDAPSVVRTINLDQIFSRFNNGYKKYETEGVNGLDSIMTSRNYSTRVKLVDTLLEQISDFVADSYAIEFTRRQYGSSADWRYDDDMFIMCLMATLTTDVITQAISTIYGLDRGVTDSGTSIMSPTTVYNARISPARNAKRWLNRIFGFKKASNETLTFMSGTDNYTATCKPLSFGDVTNHGYLIQTKTCYDDGAIVSENQNFQDVNPLLKAEIITVTDYVINENEYQAIKANPYGTVVLNGENCFLKTMKYTRKTGKVTFTLIPAYS